MKSIFSSEYEAEKIMKIPTPNNFVLNGGDTSFANRQKALFDQLSEAEKACNKDQTLSSTQEIESRQFSRPLPPGRHRRSETRQFRGKESLFKRPELPAPFTNRRSIPDYHTNPHKWVKYSLDDVANNDMSERSNTQAAFSFLRELRKRKSKEQKNDDEETMEIDSEFKNLPNCPSASRVSFKKPSRNIEKKGTPVIVKNDDKPVFRSSKVILPEYVVGQKKENKSKKKKNIVRVDRTKQMKLDHLEELEEEKGGED